MGAYYHIASVFKKLCAIVDILVTKQFSIKLYGIYAFK